MTGDIKKVLITGATGYIGGRLVPRLLERNYEVRCLARRPAALEERFPWGVEIVEGNVLDPRSLERAMAGIDVAYYLVHSMSGQGPLYPRLDEEAARNFARAAKAAEVRRIVYLGALGSPHRPLSPHLASRHAVGQILRQEGPPVVEFRAAVIIGSGSLSFEMIRGIVERHPVILSGKWLKTLCQPIAVRDVLGYMILAIETPACEGRVFEIGGASVHSYEDMLSIYARRRGLKRWFLPLPAVFPRLFAWWLEMAAAVPLGYARPLIQSLKNAVVCEDFSALRVFPIVPLDYETAVRYALLRIKEGSVETNWTDSIFPGRVIPNSDVRAKQGLVCEERFTEIAAPALKVFGVYSAIGGERGWIFAGWLWSLRAFIDRLAGGAGAKNEVKEPGKPLPGDAVGLWRVERVDSGRLLLLRAKMKIPGEGWFLFESTAAGNYRTILRVAAYLEPRGLWGHLYWSALSPIHKFLLGGLARKIGEISVEKPAT